ARTSTIASRTITGPRIRSTRFSRRPSSRRSPSSRHWRAGSTKGSSPRCFRRSRPGLRRPLLERGLIGSAKRGADGVERLRILRGGQITRIVSGRRRANCTPQDLRRAGLRKRLHEYDSGRLERPAQLFGYELLQLLRNFVVTAPRRYAEAPDG